VGMAKALELTMLGETVDAAEALRIGLVNKVVGDADLVRATAEFAARLARGPRSSGLIKQLLSTSLDNDLETQLEREEDAQAIAALSSDFAEGMAAFMGKRPPSFTGS
jgi:2-(1,2-epoxy-1,2-dihydrophenyl)acetyl-CoA isomerase